jgi:hypothetical protein
MCNALLRDRTQKEELMENQTRHATFNNFVLVTLEDNVAEKMG